MPNLSYITSLTGFITYIDTLNRLLDIQYKVDSASYTFSHDLLLNRNGMWLIIRYLGFLLLGQCEKPKRFYKKFKFGTGGPVADKPSLKSDQFLLIFLKSICHFIECEKSIFLQRVSLDELRKRRDSSKSSILWQDLVVLSSKVDFLRKLGTFLEAKHGVWSASPS